MYKIAFLVTGVTFSQWMPIVGASDSAVSQIRDFVPLGGATMLLIFMIKAWLGERDRWIRERETLVAEHRAEKAEMRVEFNDTYNRLSARNQDLQNQIDRMQNRAKGPSRENESA